MCYPSAGQQLLYTYPHIHNYSLPAHFSSSYPSMASVVKGHHIKKLAPQYHKATLTSQGGQKFTSFAKFTYFGAGTVLDKNMYNWYGGGCSPGEFTAPIVE